MHPLLSSPSCIFDPMVHNHAVNNVGTNIRKSTVEYTAEDYSQIQRTNMESAYNLTQVCCR